MGLFGLLRRMVNHHQGVRLMKTALQFIVICLVCIAGMVGIYYLAFDSMAKEMEQMDRRTTSLAEERQQVLFRSCLNGVYFDRTRSAECEELNQQLVAYMDAAEKEFNQ
jgi:hypothetical protein